MGLISRFFLIFLTLYLYVTPKLYGQSMEIGVGGGISAYSGDLLPDNSMFTKTANGAGIVYAMVNFSTRFGVEFAYRHGRIHANDADFNQVNRNLSFASNIDEFSAKGLINILPFDPYGERGNVFTVYAGSGLSVFKFNPFTTNFQGQKVFLQEIGTAGQYLEGELNTPRKYSLVQLGIPITLGVKYAITPVFTLSLELDYRYLFTDYLDDLGGDEFIDFDALALHSDQAALLTHRGWEINYDPNSNIRPIDAAKNYFVSNNLINQKRANGSKPDGYGFILLKLGYIIEDFSFGGKGGKFGCYEF